MQAMPVTVGRILRLVPTLVLALAAGCGDGSPGRVDLARLRGPDEPGQWLALGRTWRGDRFSPLARVDSANVATLGFAWEYDFRSRRGRVEFGQEATPIVVDGTMYVSGPWGVVVALDAATGKERWRYDPTVDGSYARRACCSVVNRGALVWRGRVYVGTLDGYLVALDAATGKEVWRADTFTDRSTRSYTITSPPQIAGDRVVIGNSGGEFGVRGYVTAYDAESGAFAWRFFIVPGHPEKGFEHPEMELAAKTWDPNSDWDSGLGGTVWGEMSYDPGLKLLYVGTGNSSPYPIWFRSPSGGDNLFLVSILAIRPDSGRLAWHYQQVPGEMWDYTATANMILADLEVGGRTRKVLMQAPKNGFFYVLDRETGQFISANNFVPQNWALSIDSVTGRPTINPAAIYREGPRVVLPTQAGAHNWQPMAYSPQTGLVYIPARQQAMLIWSDTSYRWQRGDVNRAASSQFSPLAAEHVKAVGEPARDTREELVAWDPVAQRERWRVPLGNQMFAGGGVLATAGGVVFQGNARGELVAYRATSGERLTTIAVGTGIMAAPVSYEIAGEQYVAVVAGYGGALAPYHAPGVAARDYENYGRVLAFKLGGGAVPLPPKRVAGVTPEPPPLAMYSDSAARRGQALYLRHCARCHAGRGEQIPSAYPQLVRLNAATHAAFDSIVLGGKLKDAGMASFADVLSEADARALHAYLWREQGVLRREEDAARRERAGALPP
jgi:quinohemoprotein ethanol dehydrogenase